MKKVLLLGGFGFLGTNIMKYVESHLSEQYRFVVFDKFTKHLVGIDFTCIDKVYAGDFTNADVLERIFQENEFDMVIHSLSTTIPVDSSNARYDVESNLVPTLNLLGLMVRFKVNNIVYISSGGAVYGTKDIKKHVESDDVFPVSSYGVVKLTIEKYLMQYAQVFGLKPLILRLSNPYGPYHYSMKQGVVNVALAYALKAMPIKIWGDGMGRKDYIFVQDFVDILFQLIDKDIQNEVVNIGSGQLLSVNQIITSIGEFFPDIETQHIEASQFDASTFSLDTTKLMSIIPDFKFTSFAEGLRLTYEWTKTIC